MVNEEREGRNVCTMIIKLPNFLCLVRSLFIMRCHQQSVELNVKSVRPGGICLLPLILLILYMTATVCAAIM